MSNHIAKRQRLLRAHMLLLGLFVLAAWLPALTHAESDAITAGLKPETREAVRGVGQALLQAKRSYTPQQDITPLRDNIEQIRRLLGTLTAPAGMNPRIEIAITTSSAASPLTTQAVSRLPDWQQMRAGEIKQLRTATATLGQRCRALRKARMPTVQKMSLFDSVITYFTGKPAASVDGKLPVITPITSAALARLEQLDTEIAEVLALPAAERQARLKEMTVALRPGRQRPGVRDNPAEETPTFTSRTQHRRSW